MTTGLVEVMPIAVPCLGPELFAEPRFDLYLGIDAGGRPVDADGRPAPYYRSVREKHVLGMVAALYERAPEELAMRGMG